MLYLVATSVAACILAMQLESQLARIADIPGRGRRYAVRRQPDKIGGCWLQISEVRED
jgi:hypothetical protein